MGSGLWVVMFFKFTPVWGGYVIFLIIVGSGFQVSLIKKSKMGLGLWKLEISKNTLGLGF